MTASLTAIPGEPFFGDEGPLPHFKKMNNEKYTGIVPDDSQHTPHKDAGSAENARSNFQPTHMDAASAENAGSNFQPLHPWRFTGIVPDDSQHTTHMDVGSAENAGSNFQPLHPWRFTGIVPDDSQHTLHPWR